MELFNYFWADLPGAPALTYNPGSLVEIFDTCLVNGMGLTVVQQITVAGGVATMEVAGAPVALEGGLVEIAGSGVAALNGIHRVEALGTNTITIHVSAADATLTEAGVTVRIPPLGWEVVHTAEHRRIYKSKSVRSNGLLLYVDDRAQGQVQIRLCEGADDIDTRHGEFGGESFKRDNNSPTTARHWVLAGDARAVYWGVARYDGAQKNHLRWQGVFETVQGDVDATVLTLNQSGSSGFAFGMGSVSERWIHKRRDMDILRLFTTPLATSLTGRSGVPVDGRVSLLPVSVFTGNLYRGDLPGYRFIPHPFGKDVEPGLEHRVVRASDGGRYLMLNDSGNGWDAGGYFALAIDDWRGVW